MSEEDHAATDRSAGHAPEEFERRRRRAWIFGDVLPATTADDRDPEDRADGNDDWLRSNVPPHHHG